MAKLKFVSPLTLNTSVMIRTVTNYFTGRIVLLSAHEIVLTEAAWIADAGRWGECLAKGTLAEVEPYPGSVSVARSAVVDVSEWVHPLPRAVK